MKELLITVEETLDGLHLHLLVSNHEGTKAEEKTIEVIKNLLVSMKTKESESEAND